jgi:signal transduction histidine kinase/GAF domain-containing protein
MGMKRSSGTARLEEQIVLAWKRYAARRIGDPEGAAAGACYLEPRPCPFEPRPDFEGRFTKDCVHCARLQGAVERIGSVPAGSSGVLPTQELLFRLLEEEGRKGPEAEVEEDGRYESAALLLRALPLLHTSTSPRRTAQLLLGALAGAFAEVIDTLLFFEVKSDPTGLALAASFRRADLDTGIAGPDGYLDVEPLAAAGIFDGAVFERLRDAVLPLDQDQDLLSDAVFDGRTAVVSRPNRELRLPTLLVEHLPDSPAAILPVFGRERVRGLLVVSAAPGIAGWTSEQMELLSAVASQAGIALDSSGLLALSRRRGTGLRALLDLAAMTLKTPRAEAWPEAALRAFLPATGGQIGVVWTLTEPEGFTVAAVLGDPGAADRDLAEIGEELHRWFEADARPIAIDDVRSDTRLPGTLPEEWGSALAVALRSDGALRGAVLAVRKGGEAQPAQPFDAEDTQVAEMAASLTTLAAIRDGSDASATKVDRKVRELEAQLRHAEKLAVVGERGIQVAQEIRNPIAAITGFARRVLRSVGPDDANREYLEIILRETERLERILTEQVSLAQMTRPRLKLQSLNALVQEVLETQSEELVKRRVRLLKRLSPDVPSLLLDNEKMRQVLVNVLQYALHQVPSGGRLRVETRNGTGHVQAEIAHDGPKTPGESLDRLFVPFSSSRRYGAGVGLAVAYQIVREHGGEIRARSEGDWSSIVSIYLPVRENHDRRGKPDRRGGGKNDRRSRLA